MNKKAFSMIEILVTLVIISILSLILIPYVTSTINESRLSKASQDISQIKDYVKAYYENSVKSFKASDISSDDLNAIRPLEYIYKDSGTQILDFISLRNNINIMRDPWGSKYSVNIITHTLPDKIELDYDDPYYSTTDPNRIFLTKFSSSDREKYANYDVSKRENYTMDPASFEISFKYKVYYTDDSPSKSATFTLKNINLYRKSPILGDVGTAEQYEETGIYLSNVTLNTPPSASYRNAKWNDYKVSGLSNTFYDMEQYDSFLILSIPPADITNYNHKIILEIDSLRIKYTCNVTTTTSTSQKNFTFFPFDGVFEFWITSAGPDRSFISSTDNISKYYKIKSDS